MKNYAALTATYLQANGLVQEKKADYLGVTRTKLINPELEKRKAKLKASIARK